MEAQRRIATRVRADACGNGRCLLFECDGRDRRDRWRMRVREAAEGSACRPRRDFDQLSVSPEGRESRRLKSRGLEPPGIMGSHRVFGLVLVRDAVLMEFPVPFHGPFVGGGLVVVVPMGMAAVAVRVMMTAFVLRGDDLMSIVPGGEDQADHLREHENACHGCAHAEHCMWSRDRDQSGPPRGASGVFGASGIRVGRDGLQSTEAACV
jgi:hypothetical protein